MSLSIKNIQLLVVEANEADYFLIREFAATIKARATREQWSFFIGNPIELVWATSRKNAKQILKSQPIDLILLDLTLPDSEGAETIAQIHEAAPETPIIVLSGLDCSQSSVVSATQGIEDFLVKGQFNEEQLARCIRYTVERNDIKKELHQASQFKTQFLANMSHELRTPLTAILGFAEVIAAGLPAGADPGPATASIVRNSQHLISLIDDILDLSKIEAGKLNIEIREWPLFEILSHVESIFRARAQEKGIVCEVTPTLPLPRLIRTDPTRLKQVLVNLVSNAVKFTSEGGVRFTTNYDRATGTVTFVVDDTGIGIKDELQNVLFQPFAQGDSSTGRKYGGSGLGLAISKQLIERLGGAISFTSAWGSGSTFSVSLPNQNCAEEDLLHTAPAPLSDLNPDELINPPQLQGQVLLVEDTVDNQELLKYLMHVAGLTVTTVDNGHEAIKRACAQQYDLILMDMHMPVMDGFAATRKLRDLGYEGAIVALTARIGGTTEENCLAAGCNAYVSKPVSRRKFYQLMARFLGRTGRAHALPPAPEHKMDPEIRENKLGEIVQKFVDRMPEKLWVLRGALNSHNWPVLERSAHQLVNAEMFGFPTVSVAARALEAAAQQKSPELGVSHLARLESACTKIMELSKQNEGSQAGTA